MAKTEPAPTPAESDAEIWDDFQKRVAALAKEMEDTARSGDVKTPDFIIAIAATAGQLKNAGIQMASRKPKV